MFLLSKIIVKEWLRSLVGSIIVLFLLITVGDILNGFLQNYTLFRIFVEYALKLPDFLSKMLPISALLATLFAFNRLKSKSELMGILAGGYSAPRIYALILLCSFSLGLIQFFNLGYVIPFANKIKREQFEKSKKNESKYLARSRIGDSGAVWYKSGNNFTSFQVYDTKNKILKNVVVYESSTTDILQRIISASEAKYLGSNDWKLINVEIVEKLATKEFPTVKKLEEFTLTLGETPEDLKQFESDITTLHFFDLKNFISRLQETDINSTEYEILLFEKISLSLICIIFSLFPLATIFSPNRRAASFGKSIIITLLFSIGFWLAHSAAISLGTSGKVPVLLATFTIPSIFIAFITYTYLKNRTL